jgi:hypothetical protein
VNEECSAVVIDLAMEFMELMPKVEPTWKKAFYRFCSDEFQHGSNGSYVYQSGVCLIDPFKHASGLHSMNAKAVKLLNLLKEGQGVLLLVIDSDFQYDLKFEFTDLGRLRITKLNGGNGVPDGL